MKHTISQLLTQIAILEDLIKKSQCDSSDKSIDGILHFNQNEISKLPKSIRNEFQRDECIVRVCKHAASYEIRYRRNGHNISVTAKTLDEAKARFIDAFSSSLSLSLRA